MTLSTAIHPITLTVAGIGGFLGLLSYSLVNANQTCNQVKDTAIFQEILEQDKEELNSSLEEGKLTQKQYNSKLKSLGSIEYVTKITNKYEELKEYDEKLELSVVESFCSIPVLAVPLVSALLSLVLSAYERLYESAKKDFNQAKRIKEMEEYKE